MKGMIQMKILFRILIVLTFVVIIYYYSSESEEQYKPLEGPSSSQIIPKTETPEMVGDVLPRPDKGLSTLIDRESKKVIEQFGEPNRIDNTTFGYSWWVYNGDSTTFVMFGIENNIVTQVYINSNQLDATPYKIGQSLDEIYRMTITESEVTVQIDDDVYSFAMDEKDRKNRILTQFDGVYVQLYIDEEKEVLTGIRFTNGETLVKHRPYEMSFIGNLHTPPNPSSYLIEESNIANAKQLFDLVNVFRIQNDLPLIRQDQSLTNVAMKHSKDMYTDNYLSHESPTFGSLKHRLQEENIQYDDATENIAKSYFDAIEAIHGWLNSEKHRKTMLNDDYTHIGSGVFLNYYTQIFIKKSENNDEIFSNDKEDL